MLGPSSIEVVPTHKVQDSTGTTLVLGAKVQSATGTTLVPHLEVQSATGTTLVPQPTVQNPAGTPRWKSFRTFEASKACVGSRPGRPERERTA